MTSLQTLETSDSFFAGLVRETGCEEYFVDRDPTHFRYVLNWLRGSRVLPEEAGVLQELLVEAEFYSLSDMADAIRHRRGLSHLQTLQNISSSLRSSR